MAREWLEDDQEEDPAWRDFKRGLGKALDKVDRPGTFCVSGSVPAVLPGLEVKGLGPVGLPLTPQQAKELIAHCEQAPYGKGEKTVVDTKVRRVWKMDPNRFALKNPDWTQFLDETVRKVQAELGLEQQELKSHLYDLLLYEPGGFFLPHRDGEKLDRMVATLVIVLPSPHEGGKLIIRHEGQEHSIDFGASDQSAYQIQFAAFYADCEHEVRPLRKGYRLCLVYNLTLAKSKSAIPAPQTSDHVERVAALLREWPKDHKANKLAIILEHQYTQDGLAWDTLKGLDRTKARILLQAARQSGCLAYLALLTFWESGGAEYADDYYGSRYGRRHGWNEDSGDSEYELVDLFDYSLTADHWRDPEGQDLLMGELDISKDEVLDPEEIGSGQPSKEDFEDYTGNAGMTLERWYQHAAIFLWPERQHLEIVCQRDSRNAIPFLNQLVTRWEQSGKKQDADALKKQCVKLAVRILKDWKPIRIPSIKYEHGEVFKPDDDPSRHGDLLKSLAALDEPKLIGKFLSDVLAVDAVVNPGESLPTICQTYGWGTFERELSTVAKATTKETTERNVSLLEQICLAKPRKQEGWNKLCANFAQSLIAAIEALDKKRPSHEWGATTVKHVEVLTGLARSLIATGQNILLSQLVDHALASPKVYSLTDVHVPALVSLRPWLKKHVKEPLAPLTHWVASCREQLESLTAEIPKEPTDYRRKAPITCKCSHCAELKLFLKDPQERVHRFRVRQDIRDHLEYEIRNNKCDLSCATERSGSPHTLVCTKNTASYHEDLKTYHQNQERLATIRKIEASLPA